MVEDDLDRTLPSCYTDKQIRTKVPPAAFDRLTIATFTPSIFQTCLSRLDLFCLKIFDDFTMYDLSLSLYLCF